MTAPDTNLPRQRKRHRTPLVVFGLIAVVVVALFMIFGGMTTEDDATMTTSVTQEQ